MSEQPPPTSEQPQVPEPAETQPVSSAQPPPPPPPPPTPPPVATGPTRPTDGRPWVQRIWPILLSLLIGFAGGAYFTNQTQDQPLLEEERVVLYEAASSAFPVAGGAFAPSFYDESTGECKLDQFVKYMEDNPERKQAWLEILDLEEGQFQPLMDRLLQAKVTEHTPVLNHGYRDGKWFEVNSVLAPGTPVMIDPLRVGGGGAGPTDDPDNGGGGHPSPSFLETPTSTIFQEQTPDLEETSPPGETEGPEPSPSPDFTPPPKDDFVIVVKCTCGNPIKPPKCPPNCGNESPPPSPTPSDTDTPRTDTPQTDPPPTESPEDTFPPTESPPDGTPPPETRPPIPSGTPGPL